MDDPTKELPRDETGSYLHLKLKRYSFIDDLSMKYAKTTWEKFPQDAQVDIAPTNRSSCRQCHKRIMKGQIRMRLLLQCHKGCKNSAYFHFDNGDNDCFWKYPETTKLESINEIYGLGELSESNQDLVSSKFDEFRKQQQRSKKSKKANKEDSESSNDKPRKRQKTATK